MYRSKKYKYLKIVLEQSTLLHYRPYLKSEIILVNLVEGNKANFHFQGAWKG